MGELSNGEELTISAFDGQTELDGSRALHSIIS